MTASQEEDESAEVKRKTYNCVKVRESEALIHAESFSNTLASAADRHIGSDYTRDHGEL